MKTYTICLTGLDRCQTIVVGGGKVAARKVAGLIESGARVRVISPELCPELEQRLRKGEIEACRRAYEPGDLRDARLVVAATDDPQVNAAVWREVEEQHGLINVVDDPEHSNFILPAIVRRGAVTVAVSTGGASPALASYLRDHLETLIDPEYGELAALLAEIRPSLLALFVHGEHRKRVVQGLIDSSLLEILHDQGYEAARQYALDRLDQLSGELQTE